MYASLRDFWDYLTPADGTDSAPTPPDPGQYRIEVLNYAGRYLAETRLNLPQPLPVTPACIRSCVCQNSPAFVDSPSSSSSRRRKLHRSTQVRHTCRSPSGPRT
jgi:hypothetical protein